MSKPQIVEGKKLTWSVADRTGIVSVSQSLSLTIKQRLAWLMYFRQISTSNGGVHLLSTHGM